MNSFIMLLSIFFPAIAALVSFLAASKFAGEKYRTCFVTITLAAEALLVLSAVLSEGSAALVVTDRIRLAFSIDSLGLFFAALIALMWLLAGIYSFAYMEHEERQTGFYRFYLLTESALIGLAFSANYTTMYMTFELMSFLSFPLVMNSRTKESIAAAQKYLYYSVFGASLGLIGLFYLNTYAGTVEFTAGGSLNMVKAAGHEQTLLVVLLLTIVGFGTKAGMFPMHAWLPTAHPAAPSPASAVLSGVITKCGIFAVIRVVLYVAGADFIRGTFVQYTWMVLALLTVFMGSMLAYKENGFKKRLAYSSVSQVSYVMFGLSTLTRIGMTGALMHVVFHSVIKDLLFMCAGAVICQTGRTKVDQLRGIGKSMPVTMWCFTIASLGLVGIPPTAGFVSKWYLAQGSLQNGFGLSGWAGPAILLVSALLTAGYLLTISISAFLPGEDFDYSRVKKAEAPRSMTVPMIILAALTVILGIWATPLMNFVSGIASAVVL